MNEEESAEPIVGARQKIANARRILGERRPLRSDRASLNYPILLVVLLLAMGSLYVYNRFATLDYSDASSVPIYQPTTLPGLHHAPLQTTSDIPAPFFFKGHTLIPLASYAVTARVLGIEYYNFDGDSNLSPIDLALGWENMANEVVISDLSITQSGRFYHYTLKDSAAGLPLEPASIVAMSANTHIIPANEKIEKQIRSLGKGDIVTLGGYLIEATRPDGYRWVSSLTRQDTGKGACEVFFVQYVSIR